MENFGNDWLGKEMGYKGRLILPEGTPVYITTMNQIAFFKEPANGEGLSRIKNVGVVLNEELRQPTVEELKKWGGENITEEELEGFCNASKNWEGSSIK